MGCKLSPIFLVFLIVSLSFSSFQIREVKAVETFGSVETPSSDDQINGVITGSEFACSEVGTGESITVYLNTYGNARNVKCALYQASDNALVTNGVTEQRSVSPNGQTALTFNFDAPKPAVSIQSYIIVAWANAACELGTKFNGAFKPTVIDTEAYNGFPATFADDAGDANDEACIYCTYTPGVGGQDLAFNLIENFNVWDSLSFNKEVGIPPLFEDFNVYSSIAFNKEIGFKLYEPFNLWSYLASSKEQGFTFFQPFNLWSSLAMASEGVALDLYFTLFEGFNPWASMGAVIAEELTLEDVYGLAALAFVMAIVGICLAVAFKKK